MIAWVYTLIYERYYRYCKRYLYDADCCYVTKCVTITSALTGQSPVQTVPAFPKFSLVDLCVPGKIGISGVFPSVVPLVHNGPTSWLFSSLFSENLSDSGRSNVGSGSARLLDEECS